MENLRTLSFSISLYFLQRDNNMGNIKNWFRVGFAVNQLSTLSSLLFAKEPQLIRLACYHTHTHTYALFLHRPNTLFDCMFVAVCLHEKYCTTAINTEMLPGTSILLALPCCCWCCCCCGCVFPICCCCCADCTRNTHSTNTSPCHTHTHTHPAAGAFTFRLSVCLSICLSDCLAVPSC